MNALTLHTYGPISKKINQITVLFLSIAIIMMFTACGTMHKPCGSLWDSGVLAKGNAKRVESLIDCGVNVNQHNAAGETPLHRAVDLGGGGDVEVASVNAGKGIIGDVQIVELLLANGANPKVVDRNRITPLHYANQVKIAELLIKRGADVNALTVKGYTPLHYIAERGYGVQGSLSAVKTAELLIKKGAKVNVMAGDGTTPLYKAVYNNKTEMAGLLLRYGANPNIVDDNSATVLSPLAVAVSLGGYGNAAMVEQLLAYGANTNIVSKYGTAPLHHACQAKIAEQLIDHGANVNDPGTADVTPLYTASYHGDVEVVQVLLARKANPNQRNQKGSTPLHIAANRGYKDVVQVLIKGGADVFAIDANGWTALHHAAYYRRAGAFEVLLANHAEVNALTHQGATPLHLAAQYGKDPSDVVENRNAVAVLLAYGADVEKKNGDGKTPLWLAAYRCDISDVRLLLAAGADIDAVRTDWLSNPPTGDGCQEVGALLLRSSGR